MSHSEVGLDVEAVRLLLVGFAVSSNNCFDAVDGVDAMAKVISMRDASSCICRVLGGLHGSKLEHAMMPVELDSFVQE